jgi:hypothetical protein
LLTFAKQPTVRREISGKHSDFANVRLTHNLSPLKIKISKTVLEAAGWLFRPSVFPEPQNVNFQPESRNET